MYRYLNYQNLEREGERVRQLGILSFGLKKTKTKTAFWLNYEAKLSVYFILNQGLLQFTTADFL